jgi:hypothetical protein
MHGARDKAAHICSSGSAEGFPFSALLAQGGSRAALSDLVKPFFQRPASRR